MNDGRDVRGETDFNRLRRLEGESSAWYSRERPKDVLYSGCPNHIEQHNREIEIKRIGERLNPPPRNSESDNRYRGRFF